MISKDVSYSYIMEYSAMRNTAFLLFATTGMDPEHSRLSQLSQAEKDNTV